MIWCGINIPKIAKSESFISLILFGVAIMKTKKNWLLSLVFFYMVLTPLVDHYLILYTHNTFTPLPLFYWKIISRFILGSITIIASCKIWNCTPTLSAMLSSLIIECLIFSYSLLQLKVSSSDDSMVFFFLGVSLTLVFRTIYLIKQCKHSWF